MDYRDIQAQVAEVLSCLAFARALPLGDAAIVGKVRYFACTEERKVSLNVS
jgi:hypothetical protein